MSANEIIEISSLEEISIASRKIVQLLEKHPVAAFYGSMGAGKTTLIKQICAELEVTDTVTSPTFAIVNQYITTSGEMVNHFDLYRISDIREAYDIGFEEYTSSGNICLIEWPERAEGLLPENTLKIYISTRDDGTEYRKIELRIED